MDSHARHAVLAAARDAATRGDAAALAIVIGTEGSTYVAPGAMALFGEGCGQVGWLSGGCLEPEIERVALQGAHDGRIAWMEVDTRDDEDLMSGSALGCRGLLRIALLPLRALPGLAAPLQAWLAGRIAMTVQLNADGMVTIRAGDAVCGTQVSAAVPPWPSIASTPAATWTLRVDARPELLVFGAGPETPTLLPLLRALGWMTTLAERRERWIAQAALADRHLALAPLDALRVAQPLDAALVMHHNFELDREALDALADDATPFVGLLGPVRRRDDLFRVLPAAHRDALLPRLRSPVGLKLGGHGADAIALSIAAQLQAWRHGEPQAGSELRAAARNDAATDDGRGGVARHPGARRAAS